MLVKAFPPVAALYQLIVPVPVATKLATVPLLQKDWVAAVGVATVWTVKTELTLFVPSQIPPPVVV